MKASHKAWELRQKLHALVGEFNDLSLKIQNGEGDGEACVQASLQVSASAHKLRLVYDDLGDVFIDAARDTTEYPIELESTE